VARKAIVAVRKPPVTGAAQPSSHARWAWGRLQARSTISCYWSRSVFRAATATPP